MTLQNHTESSIKLLFLADTHLGYDAPLRPKVQRRRRGDDFFNNYRTALQPAYAGKVDVLVHGGDMFFRSRVHPSIVQAAFEPLLEIADLGIPIFIIPGNHERSNIPRSLLENHPGIHIFEQPQTHVLTLHGKRLALVGFANIGQNPRLYFKQRLEQTGWQAQNADIRVLCMHQAIEGAQVGVQNYTFRDGPEVIRGCDIPPGFAAVPEWAYSPTSGFDRGYCREKTQRIGLLSGFYGADIICGTERGKGIYCSNHPSKFKPTDQASICRFSQSSYDGPGCRLPGCVFSADQRATDQPDQLPGRKCRGARPGRGWRCGRAAQCFERALVAFRGAKIHEHQLEPPLAS